MKQGKKGLPDYLGAVALAGALILLVIVNIGWGSHWIDSDMAAEMIFSKLLAEEGKLIATTNWFYSTEFRVLYTQLVMVPLHHIFTDWQTIRIITNCVFYGLMLAGFVFVCKPLRLKRRNVCFLALALFVPVSEAVMTHLQMGNTYMSHVILSFVILGLFLRLSNPGKLRKVSGIVYSLLFALLCMILGISGVRYLLDLLVPMMLTAAWFVLQGDAFQRFRKQMSRENFSGLFKDNKTAYLYVSFGAVLMGAVGYLINALIISRRFRFQTYDATNFIAVHEGVFFDRVQNALGELLQMFGYIENRGFLSLRGLITMLAFVMIATFGYVWWKCLKYMRTFSKNTDRAEADREAAEKSSEEINRRFMVYFAGISLALHLFVFIFTTSTMVDRYFIPIAIFFLLVVGIYMEWEAVAFDKIAVCLILLGCLSLAGLKTYASFVTNDKNQDRYEMADYLVEEGYTFGYASYWNSNIMTELSDGALEMANLWSLESLGDFQWSSKMSSYEPKEGKVFLIADKGELDALKEHGMLKQEIIFENDSFTVLHFDSQQEFLQYRTAE